MQQQLPDSDYKLLCEAFLAREIWGMLIFSSNGVVFSCIAGEGQALCIQRDLYGIE